ncbi:MAG TPA: polysaccharide deacetylase family protein [Streptosporangiaceae bacterium]|jgi:peptidoglycan/xylan/chitin deacetylase (PgdA/CDA1 family)
MIGRVSSFAAVSAPGLRAAPTARSAAAAGLLAGACATLALAGPAVTAIGPVRRALFPRLAGQGEPGHVALTFDDGPDPASTPLFLDLLAGRGVRATFFLLGSMVARAPSLAAEIAAAGHETAVHGWDHRYLLLRTPGSTRDDIRRAADLVAEATGTAPARFRPPYGVLTTSALRAAAGLGLSTLLWGSWGREWAPGATPESVYATLASTLAGGVTVLLHDSDCTSPAGSCKAALGALPMLLDKCAQAGLQVGPAAEHGLT